MTPEEFVLIWFAVAQAVCPSDTAPAVESLARAVERAFDEVDDAAFESAYAALGEAIPCVRSRLDPEALLAWHRARALGAFWEREAIASSKSWAAVRLLDPAYRLPDAWTPPGSPLLVAFDEAPMGAERLKLARVPEGGWFVDGQPTSSVPAARGFVLQGFDAVGAVVHTDYHYSVAEVPVVDFAALDPTARQIRRRRMHLGGSVLAGGLLATAVGFGVAARGDELAVHDLETPLGEVTGYAERADRRSNTAVAFGLGSGIVLGAAWAVPW